MAIETLGRASFPSGRAVVIDTGMLSGEGKRQWAEWGVVVEGVPSGTFAVEGERVGEGDWADCWREVWVAFGSDRVTTSEKVGSVSVDFARLMFIDRHGIDAWRDDVALDGNADFVFWGRDAEALARAVDAPALGRGEWGWCDRPMDEIVALGERAERMKDERGWKLATDFRSHTHHFFVLAQARATHTGSGELELAGGRTCMFFTGWGDGVFPVFVDRGRDGKLVRIRVRLQTEDSERAMEAVNR
jgi:hypothetical protein